MIRALDQSALQYKRLTGSVGEFSGLAMLLVCKSYIFGNRVPGEVGIFIPTSERYLYICPFWVFFVVVVFEVCSLLAAILIDQKASRVVVAHLSAEKQPGWKQKLGTKLMTLTNPQTDICSSLRVRDEIDV